MKYQLFLFIFVVVVMTWFTSPGCLAVTTYTYSLSANFTNGVLVPEFESEISEGLTNVTLIGVTVTGDVVDIDFQDPISPGHEVVLGMYVDLHTGLSLLNQFCEDLPDSSVTLTNEMVGLGVIVSTCTAVRTYTLMTATEMITTRVNTGNFYLINNGSANITLGMGTGGSTTGDMVVIPGGQAHFMYTVTNKVTGSHAYLVLRVG